MSEGARKTSCSIEKRFSLVAITLTVFVTNWRYYVEKKTKTAAADPNSQISQMNLTDEIFPFRSLFEKERKKEIEERKKENDEFQNSNTLSLIFFFIRWQIPSILNCCQPDDRISNFLSIRLCYRQAILRAAETKPHGDRRKKKKEKRERKKERKKKEKERKKKSMPTSQPSCSGISLKKRQVQVQAICWPPPPQPPLLQSSYASSQQADQLFLLWLRKKEKRKKERTYLGTRSTQVESRQARQLGKAEKKKERKVYLAERELAATAA